ncbi:MAG: glycoside hydrolase family 16 protein, partial [Bacteroidetes bacterium]|nr:glycoside hydrolase family 16 protein [Bacteroidota bacterium]
HIKNYYKTKKSTELANFNKIEGSEKLSEFEELEKLVNSKEFQEHKKAKDFKSSDDHNNLLKYKQLKKSSDLKQYYKFKNSKKLANFSKLDASKEITDFEELENLVTSQKFKDLLLSLEFKNTDEYKKLEEYNKLKKSSQIIKYYKFKNSSKYAEYLKLDGGKEISDYEELEKYVNSKNFADLIHSLEFKNTDEYKKLEEYNNLKKSEPIITYFKFNNSKRYKEFQILDGSKEIIDYEELETYINSQKFIDFKEYMEDKKKFEKTEEYQKQQKYFELKNSDIIKWYFSLIGSKKFDEIKKWNLTFEDDFVSPELDSNKWITNYFWGKILLNQTYVTKNEKQFFTDGENFEIHNSELSIITKKENIKGKVWNEKLGFIEKNFNYTSGLISTAHSFRQKHGLFEAKIKVNKTFPVQHAFWMLSDKIVPEIDILKYNNKNKLQMTNYWGDTAKNSFEKSSSKINADKFCDKYFIYSLEWTAEKLVWKINDTVIKTQTKGIPDEPMYLLLSSAILTDIDNNKLPASLNIDWVRCYEQI